MLKLYDFDFPRSLIAQKPARPRDCAKLLVYKKRGSNKNNISFDIFKNLAEYLPANAVLVFNQTKVIPARLTLQKQTGGKAKILYLENSNGFIKVMSDRKLKIKSRLFAGKKPLFEVKKQIEKYYFLKPLFPIKNLYPIMEKYGKTPIPPYIKNSPLAEKDLRREYQTVFAKRAGSVAAPTASLHFTKALLKKLKARGYKIKFVTLHVNLGTFAPLTKKNIKTGKLHEEFFEIDKKTADFLNKAKSEKWPIVAVGTTVARTLESACAAKNKISKLSGKTSLFIRPGYKFKFMDGLITNFHVPNSSLLMLVSAFIPSKKLLAVYKTAIRKKFRLFSFGDGMLIY